MPSMTTMALSTNIPMATIKAPREIRCKVPPAASKMGKVAKMVSSNPVPMITPLRKPMKTISTTITITTDARRFHIKPSTALFTKSGWKNTLSKV